MSRVDQAARVTSVLRGERDRGAVTAEFAVALPAVALILAACCWGLGLAATQVRLQGAASATAQAIARGDPPPSLAAVGLAAASVRIDRDGDLVCAIATVAAAGPAALPSPRLAATSCALDGGR